MCGRHFQTIQFRLKNKIHTVKKKKNKGVGGSEKLRSLKTETEEEHVKDK